MSPRFGPHVCDPDHRRPLHDARGIFCCFVCDKCEAEKRRRYRPDVLADPGYWHDEPIDE